jgi:GAF domain-containing protein
MSGLVGKHPRWLVAIAAVGAVVVVLGLTVWVEGDSRTAGGLLVNALFLPTVMMTVRWSEEPTTPAVPSRPLMATPKVVGRSDADTGDGYGMVPRSKPSLKTTLDTILSSTGQLVPYDVAEITLWDEERECCVTHGWGGDQAYSQQAGGTYYLDEGYTGWIIRQRRFLLVRDVQARHDVRPKLDTEEYPFQSYIGIPLEIQGRFVGTLELASYQKDAWSERDLEILQAMANQAVVAIENAYLYAETQRHAEQQTRLAHVATLAGSTLDLDELLDRVMGETLRLLKAEKGVLLLYDEEQDALVARYLASAGADRETVEMFHISAGVEGFERSIFARGGSYFCNDPEDDPNIIPAYRDHIRAMGVQNFAGVALRLKERSVVADRCRSLCQCRRERSSV